METSILRLLALVGRRISALLEQVLRPHGLNETDFRILMSPCCQRAGRAQIVRFTARGEALARSLLPDTTARTSAIFSDMPQSARRALLAQLRAIIVQDDRQTRRCSAPEYRTTEAPRRAGPADRP